MGDARCSKSTMSCNWNRFGGSPASRIWPLPEYLCIPWLVCWVWVISCREEFERKTDLSQLNESSRLFYVQMMVLRLLFGPARHGMFAWFVHILRWKDVAEKVSPFSLLSHPKSICHMCIRNTSIPSWGLVASYWCWWVVAGAQASGCTTLFPKVPQLEKQTIRLSFRFSPPLTQPQMDSPCHTRNEGFRN